MVSHVKMAAILLSEFSPFEFKNAILSMIDSSLLLTLVLLNPIYSDFANSVDLGQLADLGLYWFPISMRIYSNNPDQVI